MHDLSVPVVSSFAAGILIIMQMLLLLAVVIARYRYRQGLGDGGNAKMLQIMRRHGNLAENAAIFIACSALFEMMGGNRQTVAILCAVFVLGRVSHVLGLTIGSGPNVFRIAGVLATVAVGIGLGFRLIQIALPQLHLVLPLH